jgi:dihydropteroate synthase-like protein
LWIADAVGSTPILIPAKHGDLDSLDRAAQALAKRNRDFLLDPILDPIHFGFVDSVARYREVRMRHPDAEMLMGIGNLTELTHADTAGMNALMIGMCSELNINNVLATQVSEHACKAIRETDRARRILFAAKATDSLPKHIDDSLMALHECAPFPYTRQEIDELAREVRDPSFRIQTSREGIHIYNRDGLYTATDPFDLYPELKVEQDGGHAFYLGVQLGRAQIAWQLGKRFTQDEALNWGCAVEAAEDTLEGYKETGSTLHKKTKQ